MKLISVKTSIHDLVKEYPEIVEILFQIGFKEITKPMMLNTAGRIMNLEKGSRMRGIEMSVIKDALEAGGFTIKEESDE